MTVKLEVLAKKQQLGPIETRYILQTIKSIFSVKHKARIAATTIETLSEH